LRDLDGSPEELAEHWRQSGIYRSYVPASAMRPEIDLFCRDLEILLELVRNDAVRRPPRSGADTLDQGSSRLA
jgi:hypothetical protein